MTTDDLIAQKEIRECILRHFRAVDRLDANLERKCFWPDGQFIGGPVAGAMEDVIPGLFEELLPDAFAATCHYAANITMQVAGSKALSKATP